MRTPVIIGHQQLRKDKKQNAESGWKAINIGVKCRDSTEILSDWRITQCLKQWMHAWISFFVTFCMPIQTFKTNEPISKKKFSWKVGKNADTAFCIVADDMCYRMIWNIKERNREGLSLSHFLSVCLSVSLNSYIIEPRYDKTKKVTVHPVKTQISLGMRSVTNKMSVRPAKSLRWSHTHFVGFVMLWLICAS